MYPLHESPKILSSLDQNTLPYITTQLNFYKPLAIHRHEKPYVCEFDVSVVPEARQSNLEFEARDVLISDIRGYERCFTLEQNGFEIENHKSSMSVKDFESRDKVENIYLKECQALARRRFNPSDVLILNYMLRDNAPTKVSRYPGALRPVPAVHIDQSPAALYMRMEQQVGKERAETLSKGRCMIVNIWRPLSDPVEEYPLGFCDTQTVRAEDCVAGDVVKKGKYDGESLYLHYQSRYRFYYVSNQRPDEVLWLKMAETNAEYPTTRYQGVPHTAFDLPKDPQNPSPAPRESIEVRLLILF